MRFEETNDTIYCRFGENMNTIVCAEAAPVLAERIDTVLARTPGGNVVFDLKETRYICSGFLRLCILHGKKAGKERFRVENASDEVRNVFNMTGLTSLMSPSQ